MITVPELIILDQFKRVLKLIRDDYNNNIADTTRSLLYKVLAGNSLQRYKLFEQSIAVLITTENDPRHLDINMFFNAKRAAIPTIHITLASESDKNNALGNSEGYRDPEFDDISQTYLKVFNRRYSTKYNIIITSDNSNEVILLYHFFRSILISLSPSLSLSGLENISLSGSDISINSELVPANIFIRSIGLQLAYDVEAH